MTVKSAIDKLNAWTVTGVSNLGYYEGIVAAADLPALVVRLGGTGGEAMRPFGVQVDSGRVIVHVHHYLLVTGLGLELASERFYGALEHVDDYLAAVVDDMLLDGALLEPLTIADVFEGVIDLGNALYYGVTFRHRWVLRVT